MYERDHENCYNCNGWWSILTHNEKGRMRQEWKRGGLRTLNMICQVCGYDYMKDEEVKPNG